MKKLLYVCLSLFTIFWIASEGTFADPLHPSQPYMRLPSLEPLEYSVVTGAGAGPEVVVAPYLNNPGLAGFHFNFHKDGGNETDKKIERLLVVQTPYRLAVEYSPTLPDHHPYSWSIRRQQLPAGSRSYIFNGCKPAGVAVHLPEVILYQDEPQGVPVLTGFHFYRPMHAQVSEVKLRIVRYEGQSDIKLITTFSDIDFTYGDKPFCYQINFALVPDHKVTNIGHISSGRPVKKSEARNLNAIHPVLQGFDLQFVDDDGHRDEHELDEIGVALVPELDGSPARTHVWYNDKNDDDKFIWHIWYADVQEWRQLPRRPSPYWPR